MYQKIKFACQDVDLHDVLNGASLDERSEFEALLRKKISCDLPAADKYLDPWHLAAEFQLMGGHTFVNLGRGYGVAYKEILSDVADLVLKEQYKEKFKNTPTVDKKEIVIAESILDCALEKMTPEQREEFGKLVEEEAKKQGLKGFVLNSKALGSLMAINAIRYIILRLIAQAALKKAGSSIFFKVVGGRLATILAGPIGWVIAGIWTAIDIAGPAYSVTVPGVMLITAMRARQKSEKAAEELRDAAKQADDKMKEFNDE